MLHASCVVRVAPVLVLVLLCGCGSSRVMFIAQVRDGETDRPLAGALITVEGTEMMAATDSLGLTPATEATMFARLTVASPGYITEEILLQPAPAAVRSDTWRTEVHLYPELLRTVSVLAIGNETTRVSIALRDTTNEGSLDGEVVDAETGEPVGNARITVRETSISVVTNAGGRYSLDRVPAGEHDLTAVADGFESGTIRFRVAKGWTVTVDFELVRPGPEEPAGPE